MPPKEEVGEDVKQFQVPLSGSWKPASPGCAMGEGDFTVLTNMRYTEAPGIKSIFGMSKFGTYAVGFAQTPVIGYTTQQMTTSGQQTLTVSGGIAPYTWTIIAGGGSLSSSTGSSVTYTAPSSNAGCSNNPTIQVCEVHGGCTTLKLAVNAYGHTFPAYYTAVIDNNIPPCGWRVRSQYWFCDGTASNGPTLGSFACNGIATCNVACCQTTQANCGGYPGCQGNCPGCSGTGTKCCVTPITECTSSTVQTQGTNSNSCGPAPAGCPKSCNVGTYYDLRGVACYNILASGCCPAAFIV